MRYIQSTLLQHEKLVYAVRPHWIIFTSAFIYFIIAVIIFIFGRQFNLGLQFYGLQLYQWISLIVLLIALYYFLSAFMTYTTSEYGITNRRILMKRGWVSRFSLELFLDKIEAILVEQTILGRLIGYGTIIVIGTGGSRDPFDYIPVPLEFRKIVQQEIDVFNMPPPHPPQDPREHKN